MRPLFIISSLCLWCLSCSQKEGEKMKSFGFSEDNAFAHIEQQVHFGPRPTGSEALEKTRQYFERKLQEIGWKVERQTFQQQTSLKVQPLEFTNLIARFTENATSEKEVPRYIIGAHYETKYYPKMHFVGANDGAAAPAVILEVARVLAEKKPKLAKKIELVFFDGEEAIGEHIDLRNRDGLYGSIFYAKGYKKKPKEKRPKYGVILDMIGDIDLQIGIPYNTPYDMMLDVFKAAKKIGTREYFSLERNDILDDHVPLNQIAEIPTTNFIDINYAHWHKSTDTIDKVSKKSLSIAGNTLLSFLDLLEKKECSKK